MYGGLETIISYGSLLTLSNQLLWINVTFKFRFLALVLATSKALGEISVKVTSAVGKNFFKVRPMTPLPVPRSKIFGVVKLFFII